MRNYSHSIARLIITKSIFSALTYLQSFALKNRDILRHETCNHRVGGRCTRKLGQYQFDVLAALFSQLRKWSDDLKAASSQGDVSSPNYVGNVLNLNYDKEREGIKNVGPK